MNPPQDKPDNVDRWAQPDKWQVILAVVSLLVAVIGLAVQFAQ